MTLSAMVVVGLFLSAVLTPVAAVEATAGASQPETDNTVTRIHVYPNGSAQWTIRIRTRLGTDDRVTEYEAFQERFRENTSRYLDPFRRRMQGVIANGANVTGREMRAEKFTASTSIQEVPRRWGIVTYRFTWTNFAEQDNERLVVGDVFQGGFFLAANDTLEIEAPTAYEIAAVEPTPTNQDDGVVSWVGRQDFTNHHPRVVLGPASEAQSLPFGRVELGVVVGGILLLALLGIGVYTAWRRPDDPGGTDHPASRDSTVDAEDSSKAPTGAEAPVGEPANESAVMTDTERVQELLEANEGRMRQAAVADEFDWSASKTSRVVGKMVEAETVEKLQLGRENLIERADTDE